MSRQIRTGRTTATAIMRHPNFARGLAEVRVGRRFDADIDDNWAYERGRLFGMIAPLRMQLFSKGKTLNPKAVALFEAALNRKLVL